MELAKKEKDLIVFLLKKEEAEIKKDEKKERYLPFLAAEEKYDEAIRRLIKKLS